MKHGLFFLTGVIWLSVVAIAILAADFHRISSDAAYGLCLAVTAFALITSRVVSL